MARNTPVPTAQDAPADRRPRLTKILHAHSPVAQRTDLDRRAMPHLQDLSVEWVSLVDRAAVRDPSAPTEPQKFLLWKSESGANTDPTKGGTVPTAEELSAALAKAEQER